MLAAAQDNLECCILLVEGGAEPSLRSVPPCAQRQSAVQMAGSAETKALLKAICGYKDFDVRTFDRATDRLGRDMQETVDRLMEAAGRAVAKGMGLVEGQEPVQPSQEHLHAAELSSPSSPPKVDGQPS